jgi:putative ABC transport system substrate-binding protein
MTPTLSASRRTFIRYGGSIVMGSLLVSPAFAQSSVPLQRVGILADYGEPTTTRVLYHPFWAAMNGLGYVEGKNIGAVARYNGGGQVERLRQMVGELVAAKVDVITVFGGDVAIRTARDATTTIPIVMVYGVDPVSAGFAASLARPGGNITGVTVDVGPEENTKRVELLKAAVPSMKTLVFMADAAWGTFDDRDPRVVALTTAARAVGVAVTKVIVLTGPADVPAALDTLRHLRPHAVMIVSGPALQPHTRLFLDFLRDERLPSLFMARHWVDNGALMSYAIHSADIQRQAAEYVARILKGANPAVMPISRPRKLELVLNRRTATALGVTFPAQLIVSADEIIH